MRYILYGLLVSVLVACTSSKALKDKPADLKQEAKAFSLTIVKSYFDQDCDVSFQAFSDTLFIMDGDGIHAKAGAEEKLCRSVKKAIRKKEKTFQDYLETYRVELLTRTELETRFKMKLPEYYKTIDTDFFFLGFELKEGKTREDEFIWDDMFVFMVRKDKKGWEIKGVSG